MTINKQEYLDTFIDKLIAVYQQIHDHGDASTYDKGIVQGIMIAGRTMNIVQKEELQDIINKERINMFGSTRVPSIKKRARKPIDYAKDYTENTTDYDDPAFIRLGIDLPIL